MTTTLQQVLTEIKNRVAAVTGMVAAYDQVPDNLAPPCAVVQPGPGDFIAFDPSMASESVDYRVYVTLFAPAADMPSAQNVLYGFLAPSGAGSVRAAITGTSTAGISVAVEKATAIRPVTNEEGARYLACDVVLRVHC
jgi:hypothetical protein